ncbi:MAG: hypothetical protein KDN22_28995 [Verrucomicrobiae bacterium]|nr:hypothetical protein [Verrucomicrobiae bacterium]
MTHSIILRFFENMKFRDIGYLLGGMSSDAVRMLTNRAVVTLAKKLSRRGVVISSAAIVPGLVGIGAAGISAVSSASIGNKVIQQAIVSKAGAYSFLAASGVEWAMRGAAFCLGLGVPVAFSGFDPRSAATGLNLTPEFALSSAGHQVPRVNLVQYQSGVTSDDDALNRLLRQIATLEDDYQDPATLSEAMQTTMTLDQEQFPVVWEAVLKAQPPVILIDTIVAAWAEQDPIVAFETVALVNDGLKQARIAMQTWYQFDEEEAARYFGSLEPEFFDGAREWFWHSMAQVDPGLGLQRNAGRARSVAAAGPFINHYTLLQGWFKAYEIPFLQTHVGKRPKGYYPLHQQVEDAIGALPILTAEQFIGPLEFVAGIGDVELRRSYLEKWMPKAPPGLERGDLIHWVTASPVFPEDLRVTILEQLNQP